MWGMEEVDKQRGKERCSLRPGSSGWGRIEFLQTSRAYLGLYGDSKLLEGRLHQYKCFLGRHTYAYKRIHP